MANRSHGNKDIERGRKRLERVSDILFALIAGALSLNVRISDVGHIESLHRFLVQAGPALLVFGLSFLGVGVAWAEHVRLFHDIRCMDQRLRILKVLLPVILLPLPWLAALLLTSFRGTAVDQWVASTLYTGLFVLEAITWNATRWYALHRGYINLE